MSGHPPPGGFPPCDGLPRDPERPRRLFVPPWMSWAYGFVLVAWSAVCTTSWVGIAGLKGGLAIVASATGCFVLGRLLR